MIVDWNGKKIDKRDRNILQWCEFTLIVSTTIMGVNDLQLLPVGRLFPLVNFATTALSIGAIVEYDRNNKRIYSRGYKNEEARLVDDIAAEYTVACELQKQELVNHYTQLIAVKDAQLLERHEVIVELNDTLTSLKATKFHEQRQAEADAQQAIDDLAYEKECIKNQRDEMLLTEDQLGQRIIEFQDNQAQFEQQCMERANATVQAQFESYMQQITALENVIQTLQIPTMIKRGNETEVLLGNRVIEALENMGVILRDTGCVGVGSAYTVWGTPTPTYKGQLIDELKDADGCLQASALATGIIYRQIDNETAMAMIKSRLPGCKTLPTIQIARSGELEIAVDMSSLSPAEKRKQEQFTEQYHIPERHDSALLSFIKDSLHINVSASTGRGKTTLLDFIVTNIMEIMGNDVEIRYANPKPDRRYKRFNVDFIGVDESILGLFEAAIEIVYRVELNNDVLRLGQRLSEADRPEFHTFKNRFYLIDEINAIVGHFKSWKVTERTAFLEEIPAKLNLDDDRLHAYKKFLKPKLGAASMVTDILKIVWRLGRSENIKLVIAGQNLMPSQMGSNVTKTDMLFQSMIYSGAKPIESAYKDDLIDRDFYDLCRKTLAAEKAGHIEKYWGSFIPMDGTAPPSIIKFPSPITELCGIDRYNPDDEITDVEVCSGRSQVPEVNVQVDPRYPNPSKPLQNKNYSDFITQEDAKFEIPPKPGEIGYLPEHDQVPTQTPDVHKWHSNKLFYTSVLDAYRTTGSIAKTVTQLSGIQPNKHIDYQVARWTVIMILDMCKETIVDRLKPADYVRRAMNYRQLIDYLEGK